KYTAPVYKDAHRDGASPPAEPAAAEAQSSLPKMPSFFNQGQKRMNNPLSGAAFGSPPIGSPIPPAPNWDEPAAVGNGEAPSAVPNVSDDEIAEAPEAPLWGSDDDTPVEEPPLAPESAPVIDFGDEGTNGDQSHPIAPPLEEP